MRDYREINEFKGVRKDADPANLPPDQFSVDEGGDRFKQGAWRLRRGMLHTTIAKQDSAIVGIIGLDLPGTDYSVLVVEGTNIHGFTNVTASAPPAPSVASGFGDFGFGDEGFGE